MSLYLESMGKHYPEHNIIIFMDKAGWHTSNKVAIPKNIKIIFLPPCSPELNPAEHIWDYARENNFKNKFFDSFKKLVDSVISVFKNLMSQKDLIQSLVGFHWAILDF